MSETVTIVIPTYRRPRLLQRAIHSALQQTHHDLIVCVYDNASDDDTAEVVGDIAHRDQRVRYFRHDTNIGSLENFRFGMHRVDTPYFVLLSSDDVMLPDFLQQAVKGLQDYPEAAFFAGSVLRMDQRGRVIDVIADNWPKDGLYLPEESISLMASGKFPAQTAILFRREVLDQCGSYNPRATLSDFEYETRIAACKPIVFTRQVSGLFMRHDGSVMRQYGPTDYWSTFRLMMKDFKTNPGFSPLVRERAIEGLRRYSSATVMHMTLRSCFRGDFQEARLGAGILRRHFDLHALPAALSLLATSCEYIAPLHKLLRAGRAMWRNTVGARQRSLQQKYGQFRAYFQMP